VTTVDGPGVTRVLRALHAAGSMSRSELGSTTGLNRSTVASLVNELVQAGIVEEGSGSSGTVGRPSLTVSAVPDSLAVIGWDLRVDSSTAVVEGFGGRILHRWRKEHRRGSTDPYEVAARVVTGSSQIAEELPDHVIVAGIGCAMPGVIDPGGDPPRSTIHRAPSLGWVDVPFGVILGEAMRERFGSHVPVILGNDAKLGAMAEWTRGAGRNSRAMVFISGDVGIGGGVIVEGELLTGASGYAGEIGHMRFDPDGPVCRCGARGCWETAIGINTIVRSAHLDPVTAGLVDVVRAASAGDGVAAQALAEAARAVGQGLASVVNLVNPDTVVLGGHLAELLGNYRHTIIEELRFTLSRDSTMVRLVEPELGPDSIVIGAAELAFDRALSTPARALAEAASLRSE
jgi:predicted NBD/HSP70 family sugar kinase